MQQSDLPHGSNCFGASIIEKPTSTRFEHHAKETTQENWESCVSGITPPHVVAYLASRETSLEVFSKLRKGNREKTHTLVFEPIRNRFLITDGASAHNVTAFLGDNQREQHKAFHLRSFQSCRIRSYVARRPLMKTGESIPVNSTGFGKLLSQPFLDQSLDPVHQFQKEL
jgi:hypothetical protein